MVHKAKCGNNIVSPIIWGTFPHSITKNSDFVCINVCSFVKGNEKRKTEGGKRESKRWQLP